MTLEEMLAYNGKGGAKGFERYNELLKERDRLSRRYRKWFDEKDWEGLSLGCFPESERDTDEYKKHENAYKHADEKLRELDKLFDDCNEEISQYMK